ncbi:MAG: hypothetical protein AAB681_01615 [Patescibacteria group bacterium]
MENIYHSINSKSEETKHDSLEEAQYALMNSLLNDMNERGGGYDDLYIVSQARKYNTDPKFVEYVYRGLINSETIKDKNFIGSYVAHNPNLDTEPHKWAKYYGQSNK